MSPSRETVNSLRQAVAARYHVELARVHAVWAPYRICPLGAHIDHQLGPVTSMAIDRGVLLAFAASGSKKMQLASRDFQNEVCFSLEHVPDYQPGDWGNFPRGAARALQQDHALQSGIVGMTAGRLDGGGLSSSAAIGVALLLALEDVNGLNVSATENIHMHSRIENGYMGMRIGVLDQASILLARSGQLTRIQCATLEHDWIAFPATGPRFSILIAFSGLKQPLTATDYNQRVTECQRAASALLNAVGRPDQDPLLGNVSADEYEANRHHLDPVAARRARHYFTEVERVELGIQAWRRGDLAEFGRLMSASGASSIDNYECGCPPLIELYRLLLRRAGVFGTRFSGAGFRGCCVALVDADAGPEVARAIGAAYQHAFPDLADRADVILCQSDDGARPV